MRHRDVGLLLIATMAVLAGATAFAGYVTPPAHAADLSCPSCISSPQLGYFTGMCSGGVWFGNPSEMPVTCMPRNEIVLHRMVIEKPQKKSTSRSQENCVIGNVTDNTGVIMQNCGSPR